MRTLFVLSALLLVGCSNASEPTERCFDYYEAGIAVTYSDYFKTHCHILKDEYGLSTGIACCTE